MEKLVKNLKKVYSFLEKDIISMEDELDIKFDRELLQLLDETNDLLDRIGDVLYGLETGEFNEDDIEFAKEMIEFFEV